MTGSTCRIHMYTLEYIRVRPWSNLLFVDSKRDFPVLAMSRSLTLTHPHSTAPEVPRHGARGQHVYRKLRDAIQSGELKPGQRLMEIEVADWLHVSRTPVRDAMRRLESEGMMQHEPRNGLVVSSLDRQAMLELYAMREVLEGTAARLAALSTARTEAVAISVSRPTPNTVRPSAVRHST